MENTEKIEIKISELNELIDKKEKIEWEYMKFIEKNYLESIVLV